MNNNFEIGNRFEELPAVPEPSPSASSGESKDLFQQQQASPADEDLDPLEKMLLEANALKELGNSEFQKKRWQPALIKYSEALAALPLRPLPKPATKSEDGPPKDEFSDDDDDTIENEGTHTTSLGNTFASETHPDPSPLQSSNEPRVSRLRSILNANTAACYLKSEDWQSALQACEASLKDDPNYVKALHRRAQANEKLGTWASLQASLDDYNAISKLPDIPAALVKEVKMGQARLPPLIAHRADADKAEMMAKLKDLGNTVLGKFGMSTDNFKFTPKEELQAIP
ncbi:uncharacterized protein VP01_117g8 [Puccinia sorghi]|uniref:TPR-like protein n=1 Tax=Puccinia sorghi TaxID=27349 RepID=A0A0L6VSJ7_9BASI|nr:uncharacterized protein VP01_117g8 [Puccinia sorghi]